MWQRRWRWWRVGGYRRGGRVWLRGRVFGRGGRGWWSGVSVHGRGDEEPLHRILADVVSDEEERAAVAAGRAVREGERLWPLSRPGVLPLSSSLKVSLPFQFYEQFDDDEIGALDNTEVEGFIQPDSARLDQIIKDYFIQKQKEWVQGCWRSWSKLL